MMRGIEMRSEARARRRSRAWPIGGLFWAWLGVVSPAWSAEGAESSPSVAARRAVLLVPEDIEAAAPELIVAIEAHTGSLNVDLLVQTVSNPAAGGLGMTWADQRALAAHHGAIASIAIAIEPTRAVTIAITDAREGGTILREVPMAPGSRAVAAEAAALIVRSTLAGLLEGGRLGVIPVGAPSRGPEPPPAHRAGALETGAGPLALFFGYTGSSFSEDALWLSGGRAGLALRWTEAWSVGVSTALYTGVTLRAAEARLELRRHPLEAHVMYETASSGLRWTAEAGLLAEALVMQRIEAAPRLTASSERTAWTLGVSARTGARWSVFRSTTLALLAGVDVMPWRVEYVARAPEPRRLQLTALWRPRIELLATVPLW